MRIDNFGATLIATSVNRGESIRSEKDVGGIKGAWKRLRIATTKDKQLAVRVRDGSENQKQFVATGIGSGELRRLRNANINGHVLPPVLRTARTILGAANMGNAHLMSDQDIVRLSKLTASGGFKMAEAIYQRIEAEGNDTAMPRLATDMLRLAEQSPSVAKALFARINNPGGPAADAREAMTILIKMLAHNPNIGEGVVNAFPTHMAALRHLETLADAATAGNISPATAGKVFQLASSQLDSAANLSQMLLATTQGVSAGNFVDNLEQLNNHNVSSATTSRLANIGCHNLGVGQELAALVDQERQNPGADTSLVSRLVRQVRQDIHAGGVITQNVGAPNANNDKAEIFNSFHNLLKREFGDIIGDAVFTQHLQGPRDGHNTLDIPLMQIAVATARGMQDLACSSANLQSATPAVALYARQQAALRAFNQAAQNGGFPDSERAEMYRTEMLHLLQRVAVTTDRVDGTGDHSLLTKIASGMAKKEFDGKIMEGLRMHFTATGSMDGGPQHFSYGEGLSNLIDQGQAAINQFKTVTYPTLGHLLSTGANNSIDYFNGAFTNLHTDLHNGANPVGQRFFGGSNLTAGLTDIVITSSDPHKKGERVLIFKFPPAVANGPDRQLVYKPRDVRMDALLTGNRNANGESNSLADIVNQHLGANSVPTYNFLAGPGNPQNYGYVEFVPNGRTQDVKMTPAEGKQFYREYGRQVAMYVLTGTRDLHQTNMYVSNKRPVFTDLELSVDPQSLEFLTNPPVLPNGDCDLAQAGPQSTRLSSALQLSNSLFQRGESVRNESVKVKDDRLVPQITRHDETVTESYVWIEGMHQGQHLSIDNAMRPNPTGDGSAQQFGADDFEAGFHEVVNILAHNGTQVDIGHFIQSLNGLHLRYHPLATGLQLGPRQGVTLSHLQDDDNARRQYLETAVDRGLSEGAVSRRDRLNGLPNSDGQIATRIRDAAVADLNIGDVAYFTRELGGGHRELLHHHPINGATRIEVNHNTGNADFFADDGLGTLQNIFQRLNGNNHGFKDYVNALGSGFANSCRTTDGRGMGSDKLRSELK